MHILYILDFYKPNKGGIEILLQQIIEHFGKNNKVSVITWNFSGKLPEIEKKGNITIYRIKAKNLIFYTFSAYNFAKKIIQDVDIIHSNTFYSALVGGKLAKKYNKKSILHIHGIFGNARNYLLDGKILIKKIKVWKFKILEKLVLKYNFDKYICVSKFVLDVCKFYYGIKDDKLKIIYNSLDYEKWKKNVEEDEIKKIKEKYGFDDNFSLLFYGRIEKVKGYDIFLQVLKNVDFKVKVLFLIHGDLGKFKKLIINLGGKKSNENNFILNNVEIFIENGVEHRKIANYIKAVSAVVFPSIVESFGYVGLETSILQTPLICSNNGAIEEVVFGKVNFFEIGDKNNFLQAIKKAYNKEFEIIPQKNFELKNIIEEFEKLYSQLLEERL